MQLGIHFMNFTLPGGSPGIAPILAKTARTAEDIGCAWFTLMDHYFQMEHFATSEDPMLEGYTALGFVAGRTERMRLGLLVTGVTYRHPGLLAKIVTTLDVLSGGRAMLGIGAAWYEREHLGLGVPYPPLKERFERLEETLRICRQMWSEDDGPFEGTHYRLAETLNHPVPIQQPGPPILIGGGGERKTLRLVAQYGDACNLFGTGADDVAHKLDVLKRHCDELGRDYAAITKSITGGGDPIGDPDGFVRAMEQYAALGIDHVQLAPAGPDPEAYVARLGEGVIERVAALS
ncbi:LLM class F420-dependent oxidoreductase [Rathayibacter rathayi]|uniref:LLM class F420-dependent oxidoreductase n=1 Tax=Rathayibacter rathayi TaxID=33887 RepID=A0ABD6WA78_RATRA|nr:LLM class F420-dependent oxidoreductase [Rathayibacter rathayi]PPF14549.1 LLM class F420-dependent oxidoreductase [Rathayibacter rathayi]PPF79605.1 LLM class F420-dependent oxidoreductase [Rathayibacter rathayi]PPG12298.1 LLM class F420-dependent oxidoreductase [Rathayibacter rathayi]PPG44510.1 LLM class F420-dependent oxidoreductase [Rathayibacter rathayi]PPH35020.1 LLM class F420-dependent oxidoreductase [Rathayibacter rathayi]